MKLKQVKIILEKINRLYESMAIDDDNVDVFEKDLMLSYIKQLYDTVSAGDASVSEMKAPARRVVKPITPIERIPVPKTVTQAKPEQQPIVQKEIRVETPKVAYTPSKRTVLTPKTAPVSAPAKTTVVDKKFDDLFEQQQTKELSDKLSSMPIADLRKAMGLNEKILTRNELFNKDQIAFDDVIQKLNDYKSFEEAKPLLAETATKYKWDEGGRRKKRRSLLS